MSTCELNQIFLGEVSSIRDYGAFVKIPGSRQQGLIHKSQVSSVRIEEVNDVLQLGEKVWCKVINIDEDGKVGLSMKLVNQGNGRDLDPNGITLEEDVRRRKTLVPREKKAIELHAILNTTCTKCGTRGHMARDCFTTPDGKKYELLPELDEEEEKKKDSLIPQKISEPQLKSEKIEKQVKSKKVKKRKKSKKSKHQLSDSNSDDSSSDEKRKKKKKKRSKEVKKKKRKHSESSSDSSDNVIREKHSKKCKHSRSKYSD